jgi:hypothetical protein
VALGAGDRIRIGSTSLLVEALGEDVGEEPEPADEAPDAPNANA